MQNRKKYCLTFFLSFLINFSFSQNLTLLKSFPFQNTQHVSVDVNNSFYLADKEGNVFKFDSTGREINVYSPQRPAQVTLIDASKTMNVFIFYRDLQQYQILNRFLSATPFTAINRDYVGFAYMAGPSLDNNLWIFDNFTFSLKKYDLTLQKLTLETPLDLILNSDRYDINLIKEYQNQVFLNNANNGILVFDNLGNHRTTLPFRTNYFSFVNNEIYFIQDKELILYDLYNEKLRKISLQLLPTSKYALIINKKLLLINQEKLFFYAIQK